MAINEIIVPLTGGVLIGAGSLMAMCASGKIPGISGIVAKIIRPKVGDVNWRVIFIIGMILGAGVTFYFSPRFADAFELPGGRNVIAIAIAGLLVGFGTRMGGGCTSGHGVCGMGAGARDAFIYTVIFMIAGALTVLLWNLVRTGGAL